MSVRIAKSRGKLWASGASLAGILAATTGMALTNSRANAGILVTSWNFNDNVVGVPVGPPYSNQTSPADLLVQRLGTDPAGNGAGASGGAGDFSTHVQFVGPIGPSTGLRSVLGVAEPAAQVNSFQFAFDFNPQLLNPFDNFIGKEGPGNTTPFAAGIDWQVHLLGNESGNARMEFVMRGENELFAAATTSALIPLAGFPTYDPIANPQWTHVQGAYDATTGAISLQLSGLFNESVFSTGDPGAISNLGGSIFVGTGGNDGLGGPTAFAANTFIDNLQISVPEPSSLALAGLAGLSLARRRRRRA